MPCQRGWIFQSFAKFWAVRVIARSTPVVRSLQLRISDNGQKFGTRRSARHLIKNVGRLLEVAARVVAPQDPGESLIFSQKEAAEELDGDLAAIAQHTRRVMDPLTDLRARDLR